MVIDVVKHARGKKKNVLRVYFLLYLMEWKGKICKFDLFDK